MPSTAKASLTTVFAQNFLVARAARDMTQQGVALSSGVSRATIAQIEAGTGDPKLSTVHQLAEALGVSPLVLLLGKLELDALADLTTRVLEHRQVQSPTITAMQHLVNSGVIRSRLEASQIGVGVARQAGLTDGNDGTAVGAAIGSYHLPGRGTFAAAHLADLLNHDSQSPTEAH